MATPNTQPQYPQQGASDLFTLDQQTKETMITSVVGLIIAEAIIFLGEFLIGSANLASIVWTLVYAVVGGTIAGFLLSKFYYPFMDFISNSLKFLLPLCDTFFKLLFVPVIVGAILSLLFSLAAGSFLLALGTSMGGIGGGIIGGLLGGSIVLSMLWSIVFVVAGRYVYAKYMISKVGQYYKDYKR